MEIEFKNEMQHIIDLNYHLVKDSKSFKIQKQVFTWLPFSSVILYTIISNYPWHNNFLFTATVQITISIIGTLILSKIFPWLTKKSYRLSIKGINNLDEYLNASTKVLLNTSEIIIETIASKSKVPWSSVTNLIIDHKYIYVHTKLISCIQIPIDSFKSSEKTATFIDYINKNLKNK